MFGSLDYWPQARGVGAQFQINHFFRKMGGLDFILRCNYDAKYFNQLPVFYKNILDSFNELKTLCGYDQSPDIVLFNNKDILVGGKPLYIYQ